VLPNVVIDSDGFHLYFAGATKNRSGSLDSRRVNIDGISTFIAQGQRTDIDLISNVVGIEVIAHQPKVFFKDFKGVDMAIAFGSLMKQHSGITNECSGIDNGVAGLDMAVAMLILIVKKIMDTQH